MEIQNAVKAYDMIPRLDPHSVEDLLKAHRTMMNGLIDGPGKFRETGVNVINSVTKEVVHYAPHPKFVPVFISELMEWASATEHHPLITSCVFHHEFEYIHPFTDGNGRMGRMWQTLMLMKWNPLFEWIPEESVIRDHQQEYYRAIKESIDADDARVFIEFMLESILESLKGCFMANDLTDIERKVLEMIGAGTFKKTEDAASATGVSERTVRRAIESLKRKGIIERMGSDRKGRWEIVRKERCPCKCPCK